MLFEAVTAVDRYQAASRHMQDQTVSLDKVLVIAGIIVLIALVLIFGRKRKK